MAISPKTVYPGQIDTSDLVGYPEGAAQNVTVAGDGTGTPLEERMLNDVLGFQQALLADVGATPSGTPDKVGASQYLDAVSKIAARGTKRYKYPPSGVVVDAGDWAEFGATAGYGSWRCTANGSKLHFPLIPAPPLGATLTRLRLQSATGVSSYVSLLVRRFVLNTSGPFDLNPLTSALVNGVDSSNAVVETTSFLGGSESVLDTYYYYAEVEATGGGTDPRFLGWIELEWT